MYIYMYMYMYMYSLKLLLVDTQMCFSMQENARNAVIKDTMRDHCVASLVDSWYQIMVRDIGMGKLRGGWNDLCDSQTYCHCFFMDS